MIRAIAGLVLLIAGAALAADEKGEKIGATDPRARPIIYTMIAALDGDLALHQFAFTSRIRERYTADKWPRHQQAWKAGYEQMLGVLSHDAVAKLKFVFEGNGEKGTIKIVKKDGSLTGTLRLAKEEGLWRIDEN